MKWSWRVSTLAVLAALIPAIAPAAEAPAATAALPPAFEDIDDVPMPDPDLWQRIRKGFVMEPLDSPLVLDHEAWYTSRPEYIKRFVDRGSLYLHYIVEQVEKRNMPMEIALLPVIESAFNPMAYSRAKASGIWQFIPSTGKNYGLAQDWWKDNRRDIVAATDAALNYLQRLHGMFGSWELALAAYNAGEGTVSRAIAYNQKKGLPTDFNGISPRLRPETRNYVPKLIAVKNIVLSPAAYGIDLESVPDEPYFMEVQAPKKIDVKVAARLAGMSEDEFVALNPAHNKAVASGTGVLIVPVDKADDFRANLENYDGALVSWTTYQARRGESIDAIAKKHHLTTAQLKAANFDLRLDKRGRLRAAGPVMVPMKREANAPIRVAQVAAAETARATRVAAPVREAPASGAKVHTVRSGDTLYSIAQRYRTTVDALTSINRLTAKAILHPGLKLFLP
jgi:membrane-bound lytic murein transglycosylase D